MVLIIIYIQCLCFCKKFVFTFVVVDLGLKSCVPSVTVSLNGHLFPPAFLPNMYNMYCYVNMPL